VGVTALPEVSGDNDKYTTLLVNKQSLLIIDITPLNRDRKEKFDKGYQL